MMWSAAIILGLGGGLHCLGMCSPLVMAVTSTARPMLDRLIYNGGRILTYGILGAAVSTVGSVLELSAFQKEFSVISGLLLVLIGLLGVTTIRVPLVSPALQWLSLKLKSGFSNLLKNRGSTTLLFMGMLNGLLPCGLTYLALAFCVTLPSGEGFLYMVVFGLATLPVMLGSPYIASLLGKRLGINLRKLTTAAWICIGLLLAARGLVPHHADHDHNNQDISICR